MANNLDLLLRFILDQSSVQAAEAGTGGLTSDLEQVDKLAKEVNKTFDQLDDQIKKASSPQEFEKLEGQLKEVEDQVNETTQAYRLQARVLRAEAAAITDDFAQARVAQLKSISEQIGGASRFALGAGIGLVGGIFAGAAKYVADAKEATEVTRAWRKEQESLSRSGERFGAVLAEEALPLLRQAAQLADKATDFIESNPEVVRAALNTGIALATLGAVGLAVSKGIKLYADIQTLALGAQQLAAAKLQDQAADKQLAAAALKAKVADVPLPPVTGQLPATGGSTLTGALRIAGAVTLIASSVLIGAELGNTLGNAIAKLLNPDSKNMTLNETVFFGGVRAIEALQQKSQGVVKNFLQFLSLTEAGDKNIEKIVGKAGDLLQAQDKFFQKLFLGIDSATQKAEELSSATPSAATSENRDQLLKAYEDYMADDLALVQQHYAERQGIINNALAAERAADQKYANSLAKINANTGKALADAAAGLAAANAKAEQQYQQQRAQIIRDGAREIEKIQEDSKKRLQKLEEEHEERRADIIARRDALALSKEDKSYGKAVSDEKRQAKQEIQERRQAIAQRLADLQASYEQERAQRLADYQARVAEIQAQAAEQRKELAVQHAEEIKQIREQKVAKLKELDAQFLEERKRRYAYFVQQIRDLDAALIGERDRRLQMQNQMLADLDAWAAQYRAAAQAAFPTGSATPTARAQGGYADYGLYRLGDKPGGGRGGPEFVMANRTVRAAENIIGGRLTQDGILAALGGVRSANVTIQGSRYSGEYTQAMRLAVRKDIERGVDRAIKRLIQ